MAAILEYANYRFSQNRIKGGHNRIRLIIEIPKKELSGCRI